jgi:hypothetical protein
MGLMNFSEEKLEVKSYSQLKVLEEGLIGFIAMCELELENTFMTKFEYEYPAYREKLTAETNLKKVISAIEKKEMSVHIDTRFGEKICLN